MSTLKLLDECSDIRRRSRCRCNSVAVCTGSANRLICNSSATYMQTPLFVGRPKALARLRKNLAKSCIYFHQTAQDQNYFQAPSSNLTPHYLPEFSSITNQSRIIKMAARPDIHPNTGLATIYVSNSEIYTYAQRSPDRQLLELSGKIGVVEGTSLPTYIPSGKITAIGPTKAGKTTEGSQVPPKRFTPLASVAIINFSDSHPRVSSRFWFFE